MFLILIKNQNVTSVQNIIQRLYNNLSLAKEKSSAGEKLPESLSQWQQKSQLLTRFARSSDR